MKLTVAELIEKLQSFPKGLVVQVESDSGIFEEIDVNRDGTKVIINTVGSPRW